MKPWGRLAGTLAAATALFGAFCPPAEAGVRVLSAEAVSAVVARLGAEYTKRTGQPVSFTFEKVGALREAPAAGEPTDVVLLEAAEIDALIAKGALTQPSRSVLGIKITPLPGATVVGTFSPELHAYTTYVGALTIAGAGNAAARAFLDAVSGPCAAAAWRAGGFEPKAAGAR